MSKSQVDYHGARYISRQSRGVESCRSLGRQGEKLDLEQDGEAFLSEVIVMSQYVADAALAHLIH